METNFFRIIALVIFLPLLSFAGSISYDFRFDYNNASFDDEFKRLGYADFYKYDVKTGRVDFKGNLNSDLNYRLRLRFDKPAVATSSTTTGTPSNNQRDDLNKAVDLAFVQHKLDPVTTLTFGKFASEMGGVEGNISSADVYIYSEAENDSGILVTRGSRSLAIKNDEYYTGVKASFKIVDHEISLHGANNTASVSEPTNAAGKFEQNKGFAGLVYKGNFGEKTFEPIASYHLVESSDRAKRSYLAIGTKVNLENNSLVSIDYLANELKDSSDKMDNLTSVVLDVSQTVDRWTPKFKYAMSTLKENSTAVETKTEYSAVSGALEFKPNPQENFRYHVAYTDWQIKKDNTTIRRNEIIAGLRIYGDFLK